MLIDILIIILGVSAFVRGRDIGFIRQLCSTVGFVVGLLIGAWGGPHLIAANSSASDRLGLTLVFTLASAFLFVILADKLGMRIKRYLHFKQIKLNQIDGSAGSGLGLVSILISAWLLSAVAFAVPAASLQNQITGSRIITLLDRYLPPAPAALADLARLVSPAGFPQVFIGSEPALNDQTAPTNLGSLSPVVAASQKSVVKIEGVGCGGIVTGSGFVVGQGLVVTNAHVVAGIHQPYVNDVSGTHAGSVIWFDPKLDFAVMRVNKLAGTPLYFDSNSSIKSGTNAAVLGYPGGNGFTANPAVIIEKFLASGRDIYGKSQTTRNIYAISAKVVPGNSGGPLLDADGQVIGMVFAQSTTYSHVGYALTASSLHAELQKALSQNHTVSTGTQCPAS